MGPIGTPKTSVLKHLTLRNIPEDGRIKYTLTPQQFASLLLYVVYCKKLSAAQNVLITGRLDKDDAERLWNDRDTIEGPKRHMSGESEEIHDINHSGWSISGRRCKPATYGSYPRASRPQFYLPGTNLL